MQNSGNAFDITTTQVEDLNIPFLELENFKWAEISENEDKKNQ